MKKSLLCSILIALSVCLAAQPKVVGHRGCRFEGPFENTLWLVNDFEVADWAVSHGIDYISSDHPEKLVPYIRAIKAYR